MRTRRGKLLPVIVAKNPLSSSCQAPLCASCLAGKQHRTGAKSTVETKTREMAIRTNDLQPGERVSIDQYESKVPRRRLHTQGKKTHIGAVCWRDYLRRPRQWQDLPPSPNLPWSRRHRGSKRSFERDAATCGNEVKQYHGDNGVFKSKDFLQELNDRAQAITFSGVGAHHQNAVAERAIKTVVESARTVMPHADIHWLEQADLTLWPFALDYAVHLYNRMPGRESGTAPAEVFCGTSLDCRILRNAHVWGCPASYVLDPTLAFSVTTWSMPRFLGGSLQYYWSYSEPAHWKCLSAIPRRLR